MSDRKTPDTGAYDHRLPPDPATVPAGLALDTQIGMEAFRAAQSQTERAFADTQPMEGLAAAPGSAAPRDAHARGRHNATEDEPLDVATAMVVCRRNGRAAPSGAAWDTLVARFREAGSTSQDLATAGQLANASPLQQRGHLRELLAAAHHQHRLPELLQSLAALPEQAWTHMGD